MRPNTQRTHDVSIDVYVDSLASLWQSKYHQILVIWLRSFQAKLHIRQTHQFQLSQFIRFSPGNGGTTIVLG